MRVRKIDEWVIEKIKEQRLREHKKIKLKER